MKMSISIKKKKKIRTGAYQILPRSLVLNEIAQYININSLSCKPYIEELLQEISK